MTRKEARTILRKAGVNNKFSLRTVGFDHSSMQVLTVKNWEPGPLAKDVKTAFAPYRVIVEFTGDKAIFS